MAAAMANSQSAKGDAAMAEAEKALKASGFMSFFASKGEKYEKAVEWFEKAGTCYKTAKAWNEAGDALTRAADCYTATDEAYSAANKLKEAGECYKRLNPQACINSWRGAVAIFLESGKFNQCGNLTKAIAELYEAAEENDLVCNNSAQEAMEAYQQAAEYFQLESPPRVQATNQCLEKVAGLSARNGDPARAAAIYEDLAKSCLTSPLLKFNAKAHVLKALVCRLAEGDRVGCELKLGALRQLDHTLEGSREDQFVAKLLQALAEQNAEQFGAACADFSAIKPLDPWMTTLLLACKRTIPADAPEEEEDEEEDDEPQEADEEEDLS